MNVNNEKETVQVLDLSGDKPGLKEIPKDMIKDHPDDTSSVDTDTNEVISTYVTPVNEANFEQYMIMDKAFKLLKELASDPDQGIIWIPSQHGIIFTKLSPYTNDTVIMFKPEKFNQGNHMFTTYTDNPEDIVLLKSLSYSVLCKLGPWCAGTRYDAKQNKFYITINLGLVYRLRMK